jgi:hypothetical protein
MPCKKPQAKSGDKQLLYRLMQACVSACPDLLAKDRYQRAYKMICT